MLNGNALKTIATKSATAQEVALSLLERQRNRNNIPISKLRAFLVRANKRIDSKEYQEFWKDLQEAQVGFIVYGRRGNPDRFELRYNLKEVAKAMVEGTDVKEELKEVAKGITYKALHAAPKARVRRLSAPSKPAIQHKLLVVLSANRQVEIALPSNLTKAEAETIAEALLRTVA